MPNLTSNQIGINTDQLTTFFGEMENVNELDLWNISLIVSGYGHYKIASTWNVNGKKIELNRTTNNMRLIDAWKSRMQDLYEDGEDGYDNWDEVVESMLNTIDAEDSICESIQE